MDMAIIPRDTKAKLFLIQFILPKKNPNVKNILTQPTAPKKLKIRYLIYCILATPATKGANVLTNGINRANIMAKGPYFL